MPRDSDFGILTPDGRPDWRAVIGKLPWAIALLALVYLSWKSYYTVEPHEKAVVLRFGEYLRTADPGLHFKVPLVDEAVIVPVNEQSLHLPLTRELRHDGRPGRSIPPSLMLTGDLNAAVVEWTVQWEVEEPDKFLFSIQQQDVETTIRAAAESVMHRLIGDYSIDEVLTGKRDDVRRMALEETQRILNQYDCGVVITGLQMQRVVPPDRVKPAFDMVNASIQNRDRLVNEANAVRNKEIPQAEASRDKLIREAEGYRDRRKAEAEGEIAALLSKYRAYKEAPQVTRQRLYLEAMQEVLAGSGSKTIVDADMQGLLPLLRLDPESQISR